METFAGEDEAVTRANDTPFGLAASVYALDDYCRTKHVMHSVAR